jgi:hypothetical protein
LERGEILFSLSAFDAGHSEIAPGLVFKFFWGSRTLKDICQHLRFLSWEVFSHVFLQAAFPLRRHGLSYNIMQSNTDGNSAFGWQHQCHHSCSLLSLILWSHVLVKMKSAQMNCKQPKETMSTMLTACLHLFSLVTWRRGWWRYHSRVD